MVTKILIYHWVDILIIKIKKGREKYYPLGSVWNDSNNIWKNSRNKCTPKTQPGCGGKNKHHYLGPNKETLLVSGDVVKPVNERVGIPLSHPY